MNIPYRSLIEALYTLNSPPVVSFKVALCRVAFRVSKLWGSGFGGLGFRALGFRGLGVWGFGGLGFRGVGVKGLGDLGLGA